MYESPIELIYSERMKEIKNGVDDTIFRAVMNVGIEVDKEELIKALEYDRDQYEKGYADGRKDAQQWIPVSERLPEDDTEVLVSTAQFVYMAELVTHDGNRLWEEAEGHWILADVTAWMSLPEPYKAEKE